MCQQIKKLYFCSLENDGRYLKSNTAQADIAQLVEQLICNQPVAGSSPSIGSPGGYQSGQMGQTVNLLA